MVRSVLFGTLLLNGCFGSLSPDRSPTGPGPEIPGPPPSAPLPPPPPPVAIAELRVNSPATVKVGSQVQVTVTALDAAGKVVSHAGLPLQYLSRNSSVASITPEGLLTAIKPGNSGAIVIGGGFHVEKTFKVTD